MIGSSTCCKEVKTIISVVNLKTAFLIFSITYSNGANTRTKQRQN